MTYPLLPQWFHVENGRKMENRRTDSLSARNNNQKRKSIMCIIVNVIWKALHLKKIKRDASTLHHHYCSWLLKPESWMMIKDIFCLVIKCLKFVKRIKLGCYSLLFWSSRTKGIWKFPHWINLFSLTSPLPFKCSLRIRSVAMMSNLLGVLFSLISLPQNRGHVICRVLLHKNEKIFFEMIMYSIYFLYIL